MIVGAGLSYFNIADLLALSEQPRKADIIICLNSSSARVQKVAELYQQGYADTILVTYPCTGAEVVKEGVPASAVVSLHNKPESTFEEARGVIWFLKRQNLHSAIIVTDPYHMYRSKWTYDFLTEKDSIALTYTAADAAGEKFWWDDTMNRRFVLREIVKIPYYWIVHGLLGISDDPAWALVAERWYNTLLLRFS